MRLKNKRIYVADDDEHVRDAIATILEEEGAEVIQNTDGEQVFTSVTFGQPDCIIMDLYMPKSDGFESIEAMKDILSVNCPILVLTGHATDENLIRAKSAGADECLAKPLKADQLINMVVKLIG